MDTITVCTYEQQLVPQKKTNGSVARDCYLSSEHELQAGETKLFSVGIKIASPIGRHTKIYARSSLFTKYGCMLANNVGIVDADYRGECMLSLHNFSASAVSFEKYARLAQITFEPYYVGSGVYGSENGNKSVPGLTFVVDGEKYEHFETAYPTQRGSGGFGSTGT